MELKKTLIAAIVAFALVGAGMYYLYGGNLPGSQTGTLQISAADAGISGVNAVYITFSNVSAHSNTSGWQNITLKPVTINILGVTMSNPTFLNNITLKAGKYTQFRFYITSVHAVISGINTTIPMNAQFAFLTHPINITAGSTVHLVIEFNLTTDLQITPGQYMFTPKIGTISVS
ncbi:MAG: DUF4382 domain-containing protein [Thermoplasmatales archaeon]|jgi:hypothetical protein|nr:DUF4382 domain-containing protein [Thermoplasmatales archaeon]